jgi:hypothetical protein
MYGCMYVYIRMYVYICMYVCLYVCVCMYVCIYIFMCMFMYVFIYVCVGGCDTATSHTVNCPDILVIFVCPLSKNIPFASFVSFGYAELDISVMPIAPVSVSEHFIAQNERHGIQRILIVKDSPPRGTTTLIGPRPPNF